MNNKGFTLVELLVMLVVLSILVGITVPNIAGILKENRKSMALEDAGRLLDNARVRVSLNEEEYLPNTLKNQCTLFRLSALDRNDDFKKGPNGGEYDKDQSMVLIRAVNDGSTDSGKETTFDYYVRLVEKKGDKYYGINFAEASLVEKKDKSVLDEEISTLGTITDDFNEFTIGGNEITCLGVTNVK